jgi:hypothetical protein
MKNLIFVISIFISLNLVSQNKAIEQKSNTEAFYAKTGILIQKEYIKVGKFNRQLDIDILNITDINSNEKISGLKFELEVYSKFGNSTKNAFVDKDEVEDIIKTLEFIQKNTFKSIPPNYTELSFTSRSGMQIGCYYSKGKWTAFTKLERYGDSSIWFSVEETTELYNLIINAKKLLLFFE